MMRFRLALGAAVAVVALPLSFVAASSNSQGAAAASGKRHTASSAVRVQHLSTKLMSYQEAAKLVAFTDAVQADEVKKYLQLGAYLAAVAKAENTMPSAWLPTAICEEGGRDDPNAGYFGIKEWNGFDGYPTAGSAPLSVQLAWEAKYIGGPPDAPGQCHSY
ncbi:MAG TPA: hypothetical protein VIY26_13865 [Acidimicrobiales bacterium]